MIWSNLSGINGSVGFLTIDYSKTVSPSVFLLTRWCCIGVLGYFSTSLARYQKAQLGSRWDFFNPNLSSKVCGLWSPLWIFILPTTFNMEIPVWTFNTFFTHPTHFGISSRFDSRWSFCQWFFPQYKLTARTQCRFFQQHKLTAQGQCRLTCLVGEQWEVCTHTRDFRAPLQWWSKTNSTIDMLQGLTEELQSFNQLLAVPEPPWHCEQWMDHEGAGDCSALQCTESAVARDQAAANALLQWRAMSYRLEITAQRRNSV